MKIFFLSALFFASSVYSQDYWCLNHHMTFSADYGYLRRHEIRDLRLVEDTALDEVDAKKKLDTEDLADRLGWESAIRGTLIYHYSDCCSYEGTYTFFYPWHARKVLTADGTLRFPFKDPALFPEYFDANKVITTYDSWLQNAEFNYWKHITPQKVDYFSFSANLGVRVIYLKESMDLVFFKGEGSALYAIDTHNFLCGAQLGAMLEINPTNCWSWIFIVKGAIFANVCKNHEDISNQSGLSLRAFTEDHWMTTFLIEGYGQLAYHLSSRLSIHFAYQGFLLSGLALAPEQRDIRVQSRPRIKDRGQIVIDGLYAGIDLRF